MGAGGWSRRVATVGRHARVTMVLLAVVVFVGSGCSARDAHTTARSSVLRVAMDDFHLRLSTRHLRAGPTVVEIGNAGPTVHEAVIKRSSVEMVEEQEIQIARPHALATTRDGQWVHVASLAENRFASLEIATGRVTLTTLPGTVTRSMVQFTVSPDGKRMIVGGELSNTVLLFDLAKSAPFVPLAEFVVAGKPWDPVFSRDGKRVYFSLFADSAVAEVELSTRRIVRTFRGHMAQPYDMILRADGKYLFVVNQNIGGVKAGQSAHDNMPGMAGMSAPSGPAKGWLSVIEITTGKVVKELMLGVSPSGMGAAGTR